MTRADFHHLNDDALCAGYVAAGTRTKNQSGIQQ